jgi:hypothetical protein
MTLRSVLCFCVVPQSGTTIIRKIAMNVFPSVATWGTRVVVRKSEVIDSRIGVPQMIRNFVEEIFL